MSLMAMSISGAVLILMILAVRAALMGRLPKRTFAVLWTAALLRLLVPFSVPSAWSVYTLLQNVVSGTEQPGEVQEAQTESAAGPKENPVQEAQAESAAGPKENSGQGLQQASGNGPQIIPVQNGQAESAAGPQRDSALDPQPDRQADSSVSAGDVSEEILPLAERFANILPVLKGIWAAGFLLCAISFAWIYFRCYREFRMSLPFEDSFLENWHGRHPLRRKLSIRQSDQILSPLSYGVWRPVILLPKSTKCADRFQLRYVLEHEYVHIRHFDAAVKLLMAAALCIHWFNPCVYLMYIFFNRDLELACDEAVVRRFGEEEKSAYAMALIEMEEEKSGLLPLGNSFSKNAIEERIGAIMKMKKATPFVYGLSAVLVCGITLLSATSCGSYAEAEKNREAGPRMEAVAAEETSANNSVRTESLSAVLKETKQSSAAAEQTIPQETPTIDESIAGYSRKELADQIAALEQAIEEKEKEMEQAQAAYLQIQTYEQKLNQLTDENLELQDIEKNAGRNTDQEQMILQKKENEEKIQQMEQAIREEEKKLDQFRSTDTITREIEQMQEEMESLRWMESELELETFFEEHYGKYGISFDISEGRLYRGKTPVRFFIDEEEGGILWFDNDGEVVVRAVYDKDGKVNGVSVRKAEEGKIGVHITADQTETDAEDAEKVKAAAEAEEQTENTAEARGQAEKAAAKAQEQTETASAGSDIEYDTASNPYHSAAYAISIGGEFEEYEKFGLSYDKKTDFLMYKNQTVGYFKDETKPNVYTRLVEGSGKLGIIVNRDKSGNITDFSVFTFNESSLPDSPVNENSMANENTGIIRWDDSGEIYSVISFPVKERDVLEAYTVEQGTAEEAEGDALPGEAAFSDGSPDAEKSSIPKEYAEFGVKVSSEKNNQWMYKGKGVAVIYDKDHWIYENDCIPEKDAVYLEVERDKKDRVTGLKEVTKREIQKLFDAE